MGQIVLDQEDLARRLRGLKLGGKKVVVTNGCFDLLHVGHVRYLQSAAAEGGGARERVRDLRAGVCAGAAVLRAHRRPRPDRRARRLRGDEPGRALGRDAAGATRGVASRPSHAIIGSSPGPLPGALDTHLSRLLPGYIQQAVPLTLRTKENAAGWIAWQQRFLETTYYEIRGAREDLAKLIRDLANLNGLPSLLQKLHQEILARIKSS
jgi:hypothetical protein